MISYLRMALASAWDVSYTFSMRASSSLSLASTAGSLLKRESSDSERSVSERSVPERSEASSPDSSSSEAERSDPLRKEAVLWVTPFVSRTSSLALLVAYSTLTSGFLSP